MKANHTQGPWELHEGVDYITVMRGDETTEQGIFVDNIADARLVAAAPDMEAALRQCLVAVQQGVDDKDLELIEEVCRDALARAWGCQPEDVGTHDLIEINRDAA